MTQAQPLPPILPENRDAEQALLGALMINNKLFDQIAGICSAQHFASAMHARLFTQLVVLITTGGDIALSWLLTATHDMPDYDHPRRWRAREIVRKAEHAFADGLRRSREVRHG